MYDVGYLQLLAGQPYNAATTWSIADTVVDQQTAADSSSCWWNYLLGLTSFQDCLNQAGAAQISNVCANATTPAALAACQASAAGQVAQVPLDTATLTAGLPSSPFLPSAAQLQTTAGGIPVWFWAAMALGGAFLIFKR